MGPSAIELFKIDLGEDGETTTQTLDITGRTMKVSTRNKSGRSRVAGDTIRLPAAGLGSDDLAVVAAWIFRQREVIEHIVLGSNQHLLQGATTHESKENTVEYVPIVDHGKQADWVVALVEHGPWAMFCRVLPGAIRLTELSLDGVGLTTTAVSHCVDCCQFCV